MDCSETPFDPAQETRADPTAWSILREFATSDEISLPQAENRLMEHLGEHYVDSDWRPALKAVTEAEGDALAALVDHRVLKHLHRILSTTLKKS